MSDGRPALVENWLDCDTELFCRTVRYSSLDIEGWDEQRHFEFLMESGLQKDKTYPGETVAASRTEDEQSWWLVTVPVRRDED